MDKLFSLLKKFYEPISPEKFDANEWWTIFITILVLSIVIYLHQKHRRFFLSEVFFIFLFNIYYSSLGDYVIAVKPIDLYDTVDRDSGELFDIPLHFFTYPGTIYIFLHYYFQKKPKKLFFIFGCAGILTLLEWISVEFFHLYKYKGWNLFLSYPFYTVVIVINLTIFLSIHKRLRIDLHTNR